MTLQDLAGKVRIAPSHVFHVENGDKVPSEDLAVEIARALQDDEDLYRAWARARSRSDFYTAVESATVLAEYMQGALQSRSAPEADEAPTEAERWKRPDLAKSLQEPERIAYLASFTAMGAAPRPARLLVPVFAAGANPGLEVSSRHRVDVLRLDPRTLDAAEPLEQPFAYPLTGDTTARVVGLLPDRGIAIFTRHVLPVVPHEIYAVRMRDRVVLSRAMWNGGELLLLPAPGRSDFVVMRAASAAAVAELIVGRLAVLHAAP